MPEYCTSCGEPIQQGSGFCIKCGTKVDAQTPPESPPSAPAQAQQSQPVPQQYYAQPQAQQAPQYAPPNPNRPSQMNRQPGAPSDRTIALYDQDITPPPSQQGQYAPPNQVGFAPKRQAVYPQQQQQSVSAGYPPRPAPPAQSGAQPGYPQKTAGMGMNDYLINLLIMSIPFAGLIISILWGLTPEQPDRSNLAKAMIVFNAIWMVLIGIMLIVFYNTLSSVADVKIEIGL